MANAHNSFENTLEITLGWRKYTVKEPVFHDLRLILAHYNALSAGNPVPHLKQILRLLLGKKAPNIRFINSNALKTFVQELPDLLGLETIEDGKQADDKGEWGDTYAHLALCFGWSYDNIDRTMTLSRLNELQPYLRNNPPTHQLVAAYLEYEPAPTAKEHVENVFTLFKSMMGRA